MLIPDTVKNDQWEKTEIVDDPRGDEPNVGGRAKFEFNSKSSFRTFAKFFPLQGMFKAMNDVGEKHDRRSIKTQFANF